MHTLKALREAKGLLQKDVAAAIGVSRTTYVKYESGSSEPSYKILVKLAEFFDVSVDHLLGRTESKKAPAKDAKPTFDDFTFAMQNETKDLTEMDKQILLSMAKQLNDARKARDGDTE